MAAGTSGLRPRHPAPVTVVGVALVWAALGAIGYIGGWQLHAHRAGGRLLAAARAQSRSARREPSTAERPCVVQATRDGQLAGVLEVPALHLSAPVEQGTGDPQLAVAVGHAPTSVWPGQSGTSVLLAHDVSYFVHLDQLRPGDRVVYRTACGASAFIVQGHRVVAQGTPIPSAAAPALVLDTCYPPDALFFTTKRLLVWATETAAGPGGAMAVDHGRTSPRGSTGAHLGTPQTGHVNYTVAAPPALVAQGLTLEQNEAPMGTMTLTGDPPASWVQSPGPMALEGAALEAYFGGLHAAAQEQPSWWAAIAAPGLVMPPALVGGRIIGHDAPLDVEIDTAGGAPSRVVLQTAVTVGGGPAPGTYDESVTVAVHGSTVRLGGWVLTPA